MSQLSAAFNLVSKDGNITLTRNDDGTITFGDKQLLLAGVPDDVDGRSIYEIVAELDDRGLPIDGFPIYLKITRPIDPDPPETLDVEPDRLDGEPKPDPPTELTWHLPLDIAVI